MTIFIGNMSYSSLFVGVKQFQSECNEVLRGVNGMALPVGNCLGGATTINLGLYGEETPAWIVEHMGEGFGSEAEILEAFEWVSNISS